jgi:hypothetical protein
MRRVMLMNRLVYRNDWVYAEGGTPSSGKSKAPKIRK